MKGNEIRDSQLPPVSPLDPVVERRAALNVAYRLHRNPGDTSVEDVLTVLQACGLAPYVAADAKVNPTTGQTEYPPARKRDRSNRNRKKAS